MIENLIKQHRELCVRLNEQKQSMNRYDFPDTTEIKLLLEKMNDCLMNGEALDIKYHNIANNSDFLKIIIHEPTEDCIVKFSSDAEGNYYFNGRKIRVEYNREWAYRLLKTKIVTNYKRPIDFYFNFLHEGGKYDLTGNPFFPSTTTMICNKYAFNNSFSKS